MGSSAANQGETGVARCDHREGRGGECLCGQDRSPRSAAKSSARADRTRRVGPNGRVVIVAAVSPTWREQRGSRRAPVEVKVATSTTSSTFHPLLDQVATAGLDAADVAYPSARPVRGSANTRFLVHGRSPTSTSSTGRSGSRTVLSSPTRTSSWRAAATAASRSAGSRRSTRLSLSPSTTRGGVGRNKVLAGPSSTPTATPPSPAVASPWSGWWAAGRPGSRRRACCSSSSTSRSDTTGSTSTPTAAGSSPRRVRAVDRRASCRRRASTPRRNCAHAASTFGSARRSLRSHRPG